jgi:heterotetrameric sarcosine oxidase gamma subunit
MSGSHTSRSESVQPGAPLQPRPPFANLPLTSAPGRGVVAADRDGLAIARIGARKGRLAALKSRVRERFGVELAQGPRRVEANGVAFVAVGVETWLAVAERGFASTDKFAASLREALDDLAAISDQTGGYAVLRLTGPCLRDTLAKFVPLDLHARVFDPGSAASTVASHVPITLWRLPDDSTGLPVFEIAAPRSYAGSFWHVVVESAAEFGLVRE